MNNFASLERIRIPYLSQANILQEASIDQPFTQGPAHYFFAWMHFKSACKERSEIKVRLVHKNIK